MPEPITPVVRKIRTVAQSKAFAAETGKHIDHFMITLMHTLFLDPRYVWIEAYHRDEDRNILTSPEGKLLEREPLDAALSGWAHAGVDEYDIVHVMRCGARVAEPKDLYNELKLLSGKSN